MRGPKVSTVASAACAMLGMTAFAAGGVSVASATADGSAAASPAKGPAGLPTGAATGYSFGYTLDEGTKVSLLPPNDDDVDQTRVNSAPKVGPFNINVDGNVAGWPDACKLTSLAQLRALEPAITGLRGVPVGTKAKDLSTGRSTPHNTECQFNLKTTFQPAGYGSTGSWVSVQFEEIDPGSPTSYQQALASQKSEGHKYPAQYANYPNLKNGVQCFDDSNELQCLKGDVNFWVGGQKVTNGDHSGVDQAVWIDQIEIPLAEELGAELRTSG